MTRLPLLMVAALIACGPHRRAHHVDRAPDRPIARDTAPAADAAISAAPRSPRYDARTFLETVTMERASFSHDGQHVLVSSDASGIINVYAVPVGGGSPLQLTSSTQDATNAVSYFPADDRFLYSADHGGDDQTHIWVKSHDGSALDLTPGTGLRAEFMRWRADNAAFFIATNERDERTFDVYRYATDGYARTRVFQNTGQLELGGISPDGRWLMLRKVNSNADSDIYLVALTKANAKPRLITKHAASVHNKPVTFTADSSALVYLSDAGSEFQQVWSYAVAANEAKQQLHTSWDVVNVMYSQSGAYRVVVTNEDSRHVLSVLDTRTGRELAPTNLPPSEITPAAFDRAENQFAFYASTDRGPAELYLLDLGSGAIKRLSNNLNSSIDPASLVDGEVVRYKSFDDLEIPAILYRPHDAGPAARVPALVYVHGGPGGQARHDYFPLVQFVVNQGFAVLAINNRGSTGYGKTFNHLDDKKHGEVDVKDAAFGHRYLASLDWIDGARVGIMGSSYGGYVTAATLAFEPDAFEVGVALHGIMDWARSLESIPPYWASARAAIFGELGDPATDRARLVAHSPLAHAANIKKPLLVLHGASDPLVPKREADDIVAAVKQNNVPVEYLLFEHEGHGLAGKANQVKALDGIVAFLDRYLRRKAP